jgi:hypothetical protein
MTFKRADGTTIELPARTVCVAAGTSPNTTYEREKPRSFSLDKKGFFETHRAVRRDDGSIALEKSAGGAAGPTAAFFTSYLDEAGHTVSFYGDNHPSTQARVVKAMASGKDGHQASRRSSRTARARARPRRAAARDAQWTRSRRARRRLRATVVHEVNRLTQDDRGGRGAGARAGAKKLQAGAVLPPPELREHARAWSRAPASSWRASR